MILKFCQFHIIQLYNQKMNQKQPAFKDFAQINTTNEPLRNMEAFKRQDTSQIMVPPPNVQIRMEQIQISMQQVFESSKKPYLDMLVEITLQFIRAEYPTDDKQLRNQ